MSAHLHSRSNGRFRKSVPNPSYRLLRQFCHPIMGVLRRHCWSLQTQPRFQTRYCASWRNTCKNQKGTFLEFQSCGWLNIVFQEWNGKKNPINQTQTGCFVDTIKKNKTLCERPHHNWVLDIFDISNLLKSFWNVFPCKDVSFHSVREYTLSLIYTALRVVHLFFLFLGLSFQKKTSCHKFHTIHGYKRSLVIGHNLPHETRFHFLQIPISTDDLRYWDISSITSQLWYNDRKWNHCDVISCHQLDYLRKKNVKLEPPSC